MLYLCGKTGEKYDESSLLDEFGGFSFRVYATAPYKLKLYIYIAKSMTVPTTATMSIGQFNSISSYGRRHLLSRSLYSSYFRLFDGSTTTLLISPPRLRLLRRRRCIVIIVATASTTIGRFRDVPTHRRHPPRPIAMIPEQRLRRKRRRRSVIPPTAPSQVTPFDDDDPRRQPADVHGEDGVAGEAK